MVGVSVGLGNVWRFPYMMGQNGGSAFLFVYLIFTLVLAIPALMSELALGRETRQGPLGTFTKTLGPVAGKMVGYLLLITVLVADSYYLVVIGNGLQKNPGWLAEVSDIVQFYNEALNVN